MPSGRVNISPRITRWRWWRRRVADRRATRPDNLAADRRVPQRCIPAGVTSRPVEQGHALRLPVE